MRMMKHRKFGSEAGQSMTEAAIGMSLMAFAWCLMFVAAYMVNNADRCAVAARHAAWSKGNGVDVNEASLASEVFLGNLSLVKLEESTEQTSDASGQLSGNAIVEALLSMFPDIQKADVTFGTEGGAVPSTWPFVFMNTQYPFMPESKVASLLSVSSHSEWDTVTENWDSIGSIFESIVDSMFD